MFAASKTAGAVSAEVNYIESCFSTYLYTGNGSTQTITNGIDLSGKGGMVWAKARSAATDNALFDTARGAGQYLSSNRTDAQFSSSGVVAFNANGFDVGASTSVNGNGVSLASWTFRKQPKFFDVVTYTGTGSVQNISHNLGSAPACMIVKDTTNAGSAWAIYHTSLGNTQYLQFTTAAAATSSGYWNNTSPTSTQFTVGTNGNVNQSGATYVAYLFAHNAGGFGLTGTDNVISCGSFTTNSGGAGSVTLGYEPQWIMYKRTDSTSNWTVTDNMRGLGATYSSGGVLFPNTSGVETGTNALINATGFTASESGSATYIYIAIRRGPMKVPTSGTSVFEPIATSATTGTAITTNFPVDLQFWGDRGGNGYNFLVSDRLRGVVTSPVNATNSNLQTAVTAAEITIFNSTRNWNNTGYQIGSSLSGVNAAYWNFKRAPSFFDEVCYTGDNAFNRAISHNLAAVPELVITKVRSTTANWAVYCSTTGLGYPMALNTTAAASANPYVWGTTAPTSTNFYIGDDTRTNGGGFTYVSYLFATCPGVSKVGSYTGNGSTQTINCGFTGGARFVLLKATSTTGNWMVYDTARGMTTLTDPFLSLNSTSAETATLGACTTVSTGFAVNASILAAINTNGASYIFLAIA